MEIERTVGTLLIADGPEHFRKTPGFRPSDIITRITGTDCPLKMVW